MTTFCRRLATLIMTQISRDQSIQNTLNVLFNKFEVGFMHALIYSPLPALKIATFTAESVRKT